MLRLAQKAEVRNTSEVLVLISTQSHASFVALGKSLYVLKFTFFFFTCKLGSVATPCRGGRWSAAQEVAQSEPGINGSHCLLHGRMPGRRFMLPVAPLSLGGPMGNEVDGE